MQEQRLSVVGHRVRYVRGWAGCHRCTSHPAAGEAWSVTVPCGDKPAQLSEQERPTVRPALIRQPNKSRSLRRRLDTRDQPSSRQRNIPRRQHEARPMPDPFRHALRPL